MSETITAKMSQWTADLKYEDLGDKAIYEAKRYLLDSLGCAFGGTLVGSWIVNTGYTGDLCLVPSAANGFNVTVDCGPNFLKWNNTTIGFALNARSVPDPFQLHQMRSQ